MIPLFQPAKSTQLDSVPAIQCSLHLDRSHRYSTRRIWVPHLWDAAPAEPFPISESPSASVVPVLISPLSLSKFIKLNLIIYFNCACTKLIPTHKGRNRTGATILSSFERGVIHTGYRTPARRCKYWYMMASMGIMRFSASSKYSLAYSTHHVCLL
jgi:hypothetical protein